MIEELIRIEDGVFQHEGRQFQIDLSVSGGSCIGVFTDNHMLSGAAYHGIFSGDSALREGRVFVCGNRVVPGEAENWILDNCMMIDRNRFSGKELTAGDFVGALGRSVSHMQLENKIIRITSEQSDRLKERMGLRFRWEDKLHTLSMLEYYKLAIFKACLVKSRIVVLDRITEILRKQDLQDFMQCVQITMEQGAAVILLDLDEHFLFRYAGRIDVLKNQKLVFRLRPESYGKQLYEILGWEQKAGFVPRESVKEETGPVVFSVRKLQFHDLPPMDFEIRRGEIGLLTDENYRTGSRIRDCFLGKEGWESGDVFLQGRRYERPELLKLVGKEIGMQVAMPDRKGGVLFDNLTALENLSTTLVPKAGKLLFYRKIVDSISDSASQWFPREELMKPVGTWPLPERLRLSYLKWYLMHPDLLICLFPFAGQESLHHEMIIEMLVMCARRGMAVWIISSGIEAICEHTKNEEFIMRLRHLD